MAKGIIVTTLQQRTMEITWKYAFNRSEIKYDEAADKTGVYLYVLPGNEHIPTRVVYVGTASRRGFFARWLESADAVTRGGGTVFRVAEMIGNEYILTKDIYDLMKKEPNTYCQLSEENSVWIPGKEIRGFFAHHFLNDSLFNYTSDWIDYVNSFHLKHCEIWYCEIESEEDTKILETQIQRALGKRYALKNYKGTSQNWLGRQEIKDITLMKSIRFIFNSFPAGLDNDMKHTLSNMQDYLD